MDRLDLKFYSEEDKFQCALSTTASLREDQEQERMDRGNGIIISHVVYEPDHAPGETILEIIVCTHDLQEGETAESNGMSTLENLLTAVFAAGVHYGRVGKQKLRISDM